MVVEGTQESRLVDTMLVSVLLLSRRITDDGDDWVPTARDEALLSALATAVGQPLEPQILTSPSAALSFLLLGRYSLENVAAALREAPTH
jgi:hypothetical protein